MAKAKSAAKSTTAPVAESLGAALASQVASATTPAAPVVANKSAKQFIRELLGTDGAAMSVPELCKASNKTAVNIVTALSDLRSVKYAGKAGTFATVSSKRADGATVYSHPAQ
jgi:hypothetical protein